MSDPTAHHVGITVSDLDRAVDFYTETFDLDLLSEFSVGGDAFAEAVAVEGASAEFAHLDADGARIELVAYDPAGDANETPELNRPGRPTSDCPSTTWSPSTPPSLTTWRR